MKRVNGFNPMREEAKARLAIVPILKSTLRTSKSGRKEMMEELRETSGDFEVEISAQSASRPGESSP